MASLKPVSDSSPDLNAVADDIVQSCRDLGLDNDTIDQVMLDVREEVGQGNVQALDNLVLQKVHEGGGDAQEQFHREEALVADLLVMPVEVLVKYIFEHSLDEITIPELRVRFLEGFRMRPEVFFVLEQFVGEVATREEGIALLDTLMCIGEAPQLLRVFKKFVDQRFNDSGTYGNFSAMIYPADRIDVLVQEVLIERGSEEIWAELLRMIDAVRLPYKQKMEVLQRYRPQVAVALATEAVRAKVEKALQK